MGTLVTLPNLYCLPSDVSDYLGVESVELRLDDQMLASGQVITLTADAAAAATTINVAALQAPLLRGAQLSFYGSAMPSIVVVSLSTVAQIGDTILNVVALSAQVNAQAQATDSGVNVATAARMLKGCSYATAQVKRYCCNRYDDSALAQSWSVNWWATVIASRWVSKRRSQSAATGLEEDYKEVLQDLKWVLVGMMPIEDIGTRTSSWPFITNSTLDIRYDYVKARVEPMLSEGTPTQYAQYVDWNSIFTLAL
jgi:hypothetical protein